MKAYAKGYRLERKCREYLEEMGWYTVRSAGSKGAFDIIALNANDVLAIQVKARGQSRKKATEKMLTVTCPPCVTRQLWEYGNGEWRVSWTD